MSWEPLGPFDVSVDDLAAKIGAILNDGRLQERVHDYFALGGSWAGGYVERLGPFEHGANEIGCHDLLAVTLLDVVVPSFAARTILFDDHVKAELSQCLEAIPSDVPLWEASDDDLLHANALWDFFEKPSFKGMGKGSSAIRSKVMSRKRPHLIPITDSVVLGFLSNHIDPWSALRALFVQRPDLLNRVVRLRDEEATGASVLRVLDASIWLLHSRQAGKRYESSGSV